MRYAGKNMYLPGTSSTSNSNEFSFIAYFSPYGSGHANADLWEVVSQQQANGIWKPIHTSFTQPATDINDFSWFA